MTDAFEPRSKGRPSLEQAAEIERKVLEAARKVLFEHGEGATMHAVAQAAGISRKSLYARYPGKSELFVAAIREMLRDGGPVQYQKTKTFAETLRNYIQAALEVISSAGAMSFHRAMSVNPEVIADLKPEMLSTTRRIFLEPLSDLLAEAKSAGQITYHDLESTANIVVIAALSPGLFSKSGCPSQSEIEHHARRLTDLLTLGLLPRAEPPA